MKRIMSARTVRTSLARANKRLAEIEVEIAERLAKSEVEIAKLYTERRIVTDLHAVLSGQLGVPVPFTNLPPEPDISEDPAPDVPEVLVDSGDCFWAMGGHQHKEMEGGTSICIAPESQWRQA